jgi:hypothetical protein
MSNPRSISNSKSMGRNRISSEKLALSVILIGFGLLFLAMYLMQNLHVAGREFSADLFQTRNFSFFRIPGTTWNLTATTLGPASSPNSKSVLNHLQSGTGLGPWQVIEVGQGTRSEQRGPSILVSYLNQTGPDGFNFWDAWSFRNPRLAAVLWPLVQEAARRELYEIVPELFQMAQENAEPDKLQRHLTIALLKGGLLRANAAPIPQSDVAPFPWKEWAQEFASSYSSDNEVQQIVSEYPE